MGTSINIANCGQFNTSRIAKVINCKNKNEAFKMGWLDKFKDLFRGDNKKIDRLERLWSSIHTEDNNTSRLSKDTNRLSNLKPGTNLYRIEAFKRLESLIKNSDNPEYKFTIVADNNKLQFKIDANPVMEAIPISSTETTIELYKGLTEESPHDCSLRAQLNLINFECDEDFKLEGVQCLLAQGKNSKFLQKNSLLPDHASPLSHSVIKYFDEKTQEHCLLIKPKTKNTEIGSAYVARGANKTIKTSALRVVFDPNNGNKILALTRNVTCSSLQVNGVSSKVKDILLEEQQQMRDFALVSFHDGKKDRVIYTMEYKGEDIWRNLRASERPKYLTSSASKFDIIGGIMAKFDPKFGDIKAENTTLQHVFDGDAYALCANFIDCAEQVYTYRPHAHIGLRGNLTKDTEPHTILMHQLYNLSLMFYLMFEENLKPSEKIRATTASVPTAYANKIIENLGTNAQEIEQHVNPHNPFNQLLIDTCRCRVVSIEDFKRKLNEINNPQGLTMKIKA